MTRPSAFISVKDTAALLGVSEETVYRRYHAGQFPGRRFGRAISILRVFVDDLVREINAGRPVNVEEFAASWADTRAAVPEDAA
jgi:excisionase family DNA binding protein